MLVQYHHAAGTNPALDVRGAGDNWPEASSDPVGTDLSATSAWGHVGQAAASAIPDSTDDLELRWFAASTAHNRTVHFRSPVLGELQSNAAPSFFEGGIASNFTPLTGHTSNLPADMNNGYSNRGDEALTNFPMYRGGAYHWGVRGLGSRWEVDDYPNDQRNDSLHRVWVRSNSSAGCETGGPVTNDPSTAYECLGQVPTDADGRYWFNFGDGAFEASVDAAEGGSWVMLVQYIHGGGTNPALDIRAVGEDWPVESNEGLGNDLSATPEWGHIGQAAASAIPDNPNNLELRWFAETSAHNRTMHFRSPVLGELQSNAEPSFWEGGIRTNFTALTGHTANAPASANAGFSNRGDEALTNFPFYRGGTNHWGVRGLGNRWEADDYPNDQRNDTVHKMWVRSSGPADCSGDVGPADCTDDSKWGASYWTNADLSGTHVGDEVCIDAVDENWAAGGPIAGTIDNFSARYEKTVDIATDGWYEFTLGADNGIRLFVDDVLVYDEWNMSSFATDTAVIQLLAGAREIRIDYRELTGSARVFASFVETTPPPMPCTDPSKWAASYFPNTDLTGDPDDYNCLDSVDENWARGGPLPGVDDYYSARYEKQITVSDAGWHRFTIGADDGIRMYVDGVIEYDRWVRKGFSTQTVDVHLDAGEHDIKIEYYEWGGYARVLMDYVASERLDRSGWAAAATSDEPDTLPRHAIDGNSATFWHSQWRSSDPVHPHTLTIDMGSAQTITDLHYVSRQDGNFNGTIAGYRVLVSNDLINYTEVATGTWPITRSESSAAFDQPVTARYVSLVSTSGSGVWASASEVNISGLP